ncbi:hypothetical protein BDW69DRAFT_158654, partial [Aspergillus filifer]
MRGELYYVFGSIVPVSVRYRIVHPLYLDNPLSQAVCCHYHTRHSRSSVSQLDSIL